MAQSRNNQGIMRLGQTEGYCYMGFKPPLDDAELNELPSPIIYGIERRLSRPIVETCDDGTMDVGFDTIIFATESYLSDVAETFEEYAHRVAEHLGHYALDPKVYELALQPESVIAQVEGSATKTSK